jgi:hypothetical protein
MCNRTLGTIVASLLMLAFAAHATELTVGPGKQFDRIEAALAKAKAGDTILVWPRAQGTPYINVTMYVTTPKLTIKAMRLKPEDRVALSGKGFDYSGRGKVPRAIVQFNPGADGCVLEGFRLAGAHNKSHNGAGVRIDQANDITIRQCEVYGNDMGIMSSGDGTFKTAANQLIEGCLICLNGDPGEPGQNHNLYLGGTSATVCACEVHSPLTGHNIKSRAHLTKVLWCYVHDSANRELDLVDAQGDTTYSGSDALVVGNIIVKSPRCQNHGVINFGQDGRHEHDGTIYLVNNTIVTPFITPVLTLSAAKGGAVIQNNIFWDASASQHGQKLVDAKGEQAISGQCNWLSAGFGAAALQSLKLAQTFVAKPSQSPPLADPAKGDFRLTIADPTIVNAGAALDETLLKLLGGKLYQYKPPQDKEPRPTDDKPDLGAYEYVGKAK